MHRKLLFRLLPIGIVTAMAWTVAPALSTTPYLPRAVDFEQRLPAVERIPERPVLGATAEGQGGPGGHEQHGSSEEHGEHGDHEEHGHDEARFRTPAIEAPKQFDLVGIAGEERPYEVRTRFGEGEWSGWVEAADGSPVIALGAEAVQIRSDFRPRGRLHYVNVSGSSSFVDRLVTGARQGVNSAFISSLSLLGADAEAATNVPKPQFVNRRRWGAEESCVPRGPADYGRVRAAAIHHTVSTNDYSEEQAPGMVLGICRYHRNGNGWNDIGYNFLVDRFGNIYEGRAGGKRRPVVGAHAQGYNSVSTGVSMIGNHSETRITRASKRALKRLLSWKLSHHGIKRPKSRFRVVSTGGSANRYPTGTEVRLRRIFSHGDANYTECAGRALYSRLYKIRKAVNRRVRRYAEQEPQRAR